jgi:hypothetical protein
MRGGQNGLLGRTPAIQALAPGALAGWPKGWRSH